MKYTLTIILISLFFVSFCSAQILNVESLRKKMDSAKWTGTVGLNLKVIKNTTNLFNITIDVNLHYNNNNKINWIIVSNLKLNKAEGKSFENSGTQHFRYNYKISPKLELEAFIQGQYDAISQIDFRGLAGFGLRFKLSKEGNESYKIYFGSLFMYEYEKATEVTLDRYQKNIRNSSYLSFSLFPTDNISIISNTYFQPRLNLIKDFRISSQNKLVLTIFKGLSFEVNFNYYFDAFPILGVPKTQYELTNGLSYGF